MKIYRNKIAVIFFLILLPMLLFVKMGNQVELVKVPSEAVEVICDKEIHQIEKDEELCIEKKIGPFSTPQTIAFLSMYQRVKVYLDSSIIYERKTYNTERKEDSPTSGWNFVLLPATPKERNLTFVFSSPYKGYGGTVQELLLGSDEGIRLFLWKKYFICFMIDVGLFLFSISMMGYSFYHRKDRKNSIATRYLGYLSLLFSIWLHTGTVNIPINYLDSYVIYILSFASFLGIPIVAIQFARETYFQKDKAFQILGAVFVINYAINFLLQLFQMRDMIENLWVTHLFICTFIVILSYKIIHQYMKKKKNYLEILGFFSFGMTAFLAVGSFYAKNDDKVGIVLRMGILLFLGCLAVSLIIKREHWEQEQRIQEKKMEEAKLHLVISQISPHFIFNALGAIRILIKTDPNKAYHMVYDFSKYVRANLNSLEKQEKILFSEELHHVQSYANIEQVRFAGKIKVNYQIETEGFYVVPLSVQPLVENAIRHGLRKGQEKGEVYIRSKDTQETYIIEVEDNGVGFDTGKYEKEEPMETYSIGIENIRYRLKHVLGATMKIQSIIGTGTLVTITFPKNIARLEND